MKTKTFDFNVPVYEGEKFNWKDKLGISKVGEFKIDEGWIFTSCYKNDMLKKGLVVRSHKTKKEKEFILINESKSILGRVIYWLLEDVQPTGIKVIIFNDNYEVL